VHPPLEIDRVEVGTGRFDQVLTLARHVLDQDRYLLASFPHAETVCVLGAFRADECVGFLLYLVQQIGTDRGRPPIVRHGLRLRECYVEAFGVAPSTRRRGVGQALQLRAINDARSLGCYQIRSRSPVTSSENYALKLKLGFVVHPSGENDSYYFILRLHEP
jgi:GNAT superfamily N-acetyltransferase